MTRMTSKAEAQWVYCYSCRCPIPVTDVNEYKAGYCSRCSKTYYIVDDATLVTLESPFGALEAWNWIWVL